MEMNVLTCQAGPQIMDLHLTVVSPVTESHPLLYRCGSVCWPMQCPILHITHPHGIICNRAHRLPPCVLVIFCSMQFLRPGKHRMSNARLSDVLPTLNLSGKESQSSLRVSS